MVPNESHSLSPSLSKRWEKRSEENELRSSSIRKVCYPLLKCNQWLDERKLNGRMGTACSRPLLFSFKITHANDTCKCHITNEAREALWQAGVDRGLVPGGYTKYIQALEVSWNKSFWDLCQITYDDLMAETDSEITPAGRINTTSRRSFVERISSA